MIQLQFYMYCLNSFYGARRAEIFNKQQEIQLGIDKACFFRIWKKLTAVKKPFEGYMIIGNWWWWQMT